MPDACPPKETDASSLAASPQLVIITGMSGAGRSEAMHTFEDLGYFCIDNLPPSFMGQLIDLSELPDSKLRRLAVVCDVRGHEFFAELSGELDRLEARGVDIRLLFLEADDEVLLRRFKETRRRHPMCEEGGSLVEGINAERTVLELVRDRADLVIDSSELRPQELRQAIRERFTDSLTETLSVTVYSFGFKYSIPADADIVMDVRFLPNPHYNPELRPLTGLDRPVAEYVMGRPETAEFLAKWLDLLDTVVPGYVMEGKHHLSIALGCTGGMHRSVALAEATATHLRGKGYHVAVSHRDIGRDRSAR
ncbi:MAG TPA: RNase adapter RapZ [Coriobacteriia bacterium]|nr:RNase adapter RapZ [Coriobacteriia bacterium]